MQAVEWDRAYDVVTVRHETDRPGRPAMDAAIQGLGYGVEEPAAAPAATAEAPPNAPGPAGPASAVPEGVRDVFARARAEGKLVLLKFATES